jgi:ABC-type dipeptide/oligopeptide/nickel transport system ATPase component
MASVPRLDETWQERDTVAVETIEADVAGAGCVYYGRCPIGDRALGCHEQHPQLIEAEPDHLVACYAVERGLSTSGPSSDRAPVSTG